MKTDALNRRRAPRHAVRMICQAVREKDFKLLGEIALDVSAGGMRVRTRARVLTGEPVIVSFFEPEHARWYDLEATVARVMHGRRVRDDERSVGLCFESLDAASRAGLRAALGARVRPPAPRVAAA